MTVDAANLLSALLGASIGSLVTVILYLHDRGRRERAAMRVVHTELVMVGTYVQALLQGGAIVGPMNLPALNAQLPAIAGRLSGDELRLLASAALLMPTLQRVQDRVGMHPGGSYSSEQLGALSAGYDGLMEAAEMLRKKAY